MGVRLGYGAWLCLLAACGSEWSSEDLDGDGYSVAQGDCWDNPDAPAAGVLTAYDVHPGTGNETWYDGIDENCDDADDYDKDGDGHKSDAYGGDDCWDDTDVVPDGFVAANGYYQPIAREVHPGATEVWYDGVDADCSAGSDFDQDEDGYESEWRVPAGGASGPDCFDAMDDPFSNPAGLDPDDVNPGAEETWYDGTDQNCDGESDDDQDGDGFDRDEECEDRDASIFPNDDTEVWYDGIDSDCSGGSDFDQDGDGYDSALYGGDDCNDDPAVEIEGVEGYDAVPAWEMYPGASDLPYDGVDADCAEDSDFDADGDGEDADDHPDGAGATGTDCDDADGTVFSGASETWYDGEDVDCSGGSDYDQDGDGHDAEGYGVGTDDDCDDTRAEAYPGAEESCSDAADDDCDGTANDEDAADCITFHLDADADGYGVLDDSACFCAPSDDYAVVGTDADSEDCDDADAAVNPGVASEDCFTAGDDNCDGSTDALDADNCSPFYADADGDAYGAGAGECHCEATSDYPASTDDDCDDADPAVSPGEPEVCDLADQDCDGAIDEGSVHYYDDADADGFGDDATESCTAGAESVEVGGDCDDGAVGVYPGAVELCDEVQNDCDLTSWSATDEEGVASFLSDDGAWSDVTADFSVGSAGAADVIALSAGSYRLCPGTWYEGVAVSAGDVELIAPYGATDTILDLDGYAASVVSVTNATLYVEGFTLTGGAGTVTGSTSYGGGAFSFATTAGSTSTLTLQDCIVTDNAATYGGGVSSYSYGDVVLVDTEVFGNTAATSGGGLYIQKGEVSCEGGGVYSNIATSSEGGGAWFGYQQGGIEVTTSDWTGNSPDDVAGTGSGFATVDDSTYGTGATFSCRGYSGCSP